MSKRVSFALLLWLTPAVARADDAPPAVALPPAVDEAARLYDEARTAFQEGRDDVALTKIEASLRALDSPNSELLRAHVLHREQRLVEAHASYEAALRGATARLNAGETRFEPTVAEAGRSLALLRAKLGELQVVVRGAPEATVEVGGHAIALTTREGGDRVGAAWLEPGTVDVLARRAGATRTSRATLTASRRTEVLLDFAPPPPPAPESSAAPPVATWVAAGVGVAGGVVFGVFGGLALGIDDDLSACSPRCPASRRADADRGESYQTAANVGLAVGAVGLATAAVVWIVDAATSGRPASRQAAQPAFALRF